MVEVFEAEGKGIDLMPDSILPTPTHRSDIFQCARCGEDHQQLSFRKFIKSPVVDEDGTVWDYWAVCPTTGDPVLQKHEDIPESA